MKLASNMSSTTWCRNIISQIEANAAFQPLDCCIGGDTIDTAWKKFRSNIRNGKSKK